MSDVRLPSHLSIVWDLELNDDESDDESALVNDAGQRWHRSSAVLFGHHRLVFVQASRRHIKTGTSCNKR